MNPDTEVSFSRAQITKGLEHKASVLYIPPLSIAVGSQMKMDVPNKLIIFIWNKQVSRKKKTYKKKQKLCDQFHEDTNIASIQLLLSYTSKKADHDPVYMKNLLGHTKRQQDKNFKLLHILFRFHIRGSMILLFK